MRRRRRPDVRVALVGLAVGVLGLTACTAAAPPSGAAGARRSASPSSTADPLLAELDRPGDPGWHVVRPAKVTQLAGYVSPASVLPGDVLHLHLRSTVPAVHLEVFRSGWYAGAGARLVASRDIVVKAPTPPVLLSAATRTWTAGWADSTDLSSAAWPPGHYLVLASSGGVQTWVPFTVRSPDVRGRVVVITENTTWQAYNGYGGASLYHGADGARRTRAYAVSFDRPLDAGNGAADYAGNELPAIQLAEKLRLPLAYLTDTDLQAPPGVLDGARAVVSLGHDEYYSSVMRDQLLHARDTTGTNLAFLGANALFRHIRLGPLDGVPDRLETNYKDASLDPFSKTDPAEATGDWPDPPVPRSEDELTGGSYRCNPVDAPMVVADADSWLTSGLGLRVGQQLPHLVGSEYDGIQLDALAPRHMTSVMHSPVTCAGQRDAADVSYYTVASGGAGIDVGTNAWVCALAAACGPRAISQQVQSVVVAMTTRMLQEFAAGPAGQAHPVPLGLVTASPSPRPELRAGVRSQQSG